MVAVGFVASLWLPDTTTSGYVRAALEAGLVGGLADWFAVVALFRHPLGIPIPHTAVIPRSKDGLGANLAGFMRDNFLEPAQVTERLTDVAHVDRLGRWLAEPDHAARVATHLAGLLRDVLAGQDEPAIVDRMASGMRRRLDALEVGRLAGAGLERAVLDRRHEALLDSTLEALREAVVRNRGPLRRRLGTQSPSWVPEFVDDIVFDRADEVLRKFLGEVAQDRSHELRRVLDEQLLALGERLQHDEAVQQKVHDTLGELVDQDQLREWARLWWQQLLAAVEAAADPAGDGGVLRRTAVEAVTDLGRRLQHDPELRERVRAGLEAAAPRLAATGQQEIGGIIAATIDRWDAQETSQRLEAWMGPDLQFVRINGTVVGALVGVGLHAIATAVG